MGGGCSCANKSQQHHVKDPKHKNSLNEEYNSTIKKQIKSNLQKDQIQQELKPSNIEYEVGPVLFNRLLQKYERKKNDKSTEIWESKLKKNYGKKGKELLDSLELENQAYLKNIEEEELFLFINYNQKDYIQTLLKFIPPTNLRFSIWKLKFLNMDLYDSSLYDKLLVQKTKQEEQILKDIGRSFPEFEYFQVLSENSQMSIGQDALYRVLKAISIYYGDVGYTQGMNFVVGFLLLVNGGNEVEAFWLFIELCRHKDFMLMGFYEEDFPMVNLLLLVFQKKFQQQLPELYQHFEEQMVSESMWIWQWLLTMFVYSFPIECAVRLWDFMLATNIFGLLRISLAILQRKKSILMEMDQTDIVMYFKTFKDNSEIFTNKDDENYQDIEEIIEIARDINIEKDFIRLQAQNLSQQGPCLYGGKDLKDSIFINYFKSYGKEDKQTQEKVHSIIKQKSLSERQLTLIKHSVLSQKQSLDQKQNKDNNNNDVDTQENSQTINLEIQNNNSYQQNNRKYKRNSQQNHNLNYLPKIQNYDSKKYQNYDSGKIDYQENQMNNSYQNQKITENDKDSEFSNQKSNKNICFSMENSKQQKINKSQSEQKQKQSSDECTINFEMRKVSESLKKSIIHGPILKKNPQSFIIDDHISQQNIQNQIKILEKENDAKSKKSQEINKKEFIQFSSEEEDDTTKENTDNFNFNKNNINNNQEDIEEINKNNMEDFSQTNIQTNSFQNIYQKKDKSQYSLDSDKELNKNSKFNSNRKININQNFDLQDQIEIEKNIQNKSKNDIDFQQKLQLVDITEDKNTSIINENQQNNNLNNSIQKIEEQQNLQIKVDQNNFSNNTQNLENIQQNHDITDLINQNIESNDQIQKDLQLQNNIKEEQEFNEQNQYFEDQTQNNINNNNINQNNEFNNQIETEVIV